MIEKINWDNYFHKICEAVASKSPCLSRQIGAILVRDHSIISTGYNGPARGIPHCGPNRLGKDNTLNILHSDESAKLYPSYEVSSTCPRKLLGFKSGTGMEYCPAQHAEENCISNAARLGVSVLNSTLYMNCVIPCKNCLSTLINAGIMQIVVDQASVYDSHTKYIIDNSNIDIREFEL